jgi:hypothetical protein
MMLMYLPTFRIRLPSLRLAVAAALVAFSAAAPAQLVVYPVRLVLDPDKRADQLEIINNSARPVTYVITLQNRRMDENGRFAAAETALPGEQFADSMLRYSPRRVTLAPGMSQVIRIMARRPADLAPGEYRSHLLFSEQAVPRGATSIEKPNTEQGIGVSLTALVGISVPIIVRAGQTTATVKMENLAMTPASDAEPATVLFDFLRDGNRSVYGDFTATFEPTGGRAVDVGRAAGVAVYTPNALRHMRFPLNPPAGVSLAAGTLTVTFRERDGSVVARASRQVP